METKWYKIYYNRKGVEVCRIVESKYIDAYINNLKKYVRGNIDVEELTIKEIQLKLF